MELSTLSIKRTSSSPSDFWGNAERMVVIVATTDVPNVLVAYGVDPDRNQKVFETSVFTNQLGTFFKFLIDGQAVVRTPSARTAGARDAAALASTPVPLLDIPAQQPPPTGPKLQVVLTYASAVSSDESLAELGEQDAATT
jgi:hypothetical protein